MTIEKAYKKALFGARISILFGIGVQLCIVYYFFRYDQSIVDLGLRESVEIRNYHWARAFKAPFLLVLCNCAILAIIGFDTLAFLRKRREKPLPQALCDSEGKRLTIAHNQAVLWIVMATLLTVTGAFLYGYYNDWLNWFSRNSTSPAENAFFVRRFRILCYAIVPALGAVLILSGISTIRCLKKLGVSEAGALTRDSDQFKNDL
jgi:hypothetical protein